MGRKIRFGGPRLPDGSSTWYEHHNPDGSYGGQIVVRPGDVVDESNIGGEIQMDTSKSVVFDESKGTYVEKENPPQTVKSNKADYYVKGGMALYQTAATASPVTP